MVHWSFLKKENHLNGISVAQKAIYEIRRFRRLSIWISNNDGNSAGRMAEWVARLPTILFTAGSMPLLAFLFLLIFFKFFKTLSDLKFIL